MCLIWVGAKFYRTVGLQDQGLDTPALLLQNFITGLLQLNSESFETKLGLVVLPNNTSLLAMQSCVFIQIKNNQMRLQRRLPVFTMQLRHC